MSADWRKFKAMISLRKNATGEVRAIEHWSFEPYEDGDYLWTEGNYACDCNRHLFFERAGGREPESREVACGDEKYTATHGTREDGSSFTLDDV
jgi:hypothetical protein